MPSRSCFEQHNAEEMVSFWKSGVKLFAEDMASGVCLGVAVAGPVLISSLQS